MSEVSAPAPDLDRFELREVLGHGGMGEVRCARDRRIGREVAVKRMRGRIDDASRARFLREARVQGRLDHPAVVPLYDLGTDETGAPYFAMKRLTGVTLHEVIWSHGRGDADALARWPRRLLLARLVEVCLAIEFAHARGVIHRDLKPSNIMLGDYGEVYVLDWGIARMLDEPPIDPFVAHGAAEDPDALHTVAGAQLGTPGYMPPEQVRGESVDGRADVYALGCILFELLTGRPALERGPHVLEVTLMAPAHRPRLRYPELDIPPELDELCARATAPDRASRTLTPRALADGLQRYLDGDRDLQRRRELASEHAASARTALQDGDRPRAMREAGRALALAPEDAATQELVGHLMLSPQQAAVPEVERELADEAVRTGLGQLRTAVVVYLAFLCGVLAMLGFGVRSPAWMIGLVAGVVANLFAFGTVARLRRPIGRWWYLGLVVHCTTLALTGFVVGPLLAVPTFIVGSVAAFVSQPMVSRPLVAVAAHFAAVLVPIVAELAGLVPRTFHLDADGLRLAPAAVALTPGSLVTFAVVGTVAQLLSTSLLVLQLRRARDAASRTTTHQLWHLRQLLPGSR